MARGQTTTIKLGRQEVAGLITDHVADMFKNPVNVTNVEVHRDGSASVVYRAAGDVPLPLDLGGEAGQAKTGDAE